MMKILLFLFWYFTIKSLGVSFLLLVDRLVILLFIWRNWRCSRHIRIIIHAEYFFISLSLKYIRTLLHKRMSLSPVIIFIISSKSVHIERLKFILELQCLIIHQEYLLNLFHSFITKTGIISLFI